MVYTLDHLDPFDFMIDFEGKIRTISVLFGCHCFTEKLEPYHTPDFRYNHGHESRAFDFARHGLSKLLPDMIRTLGARSVYMTQAANYFLLRQNPMAGFNGPYLVFFNVINQRKRMSMLS